MDPGDYKISTVKNLSDEEMTRMSVYAAKAFIQAEQQSFLDQWFVGVFGKYEENARVHDLFFKAWISAACQCGCIITNETRTGWRGLLGPDDVWHFADPDHPLGKSKALDELFTLIDKDQFYARQKQFAQAGKEARERADGPIPRALWGFTLVVDPEHQHKGIGKAIQQYTEDLAAKDGLAVAFGTEPWNLEMYKRRGYAVSGEYPIRQPGMAEEGKQYCLIKRFEAVKA